MENQIQVRPINKKKLNDYVSKLVPNKENETYMFEYVGLLCEKEPDGENCITDNECCYFIANKKFINGELAITYECPVWVSVKTETGRTIGGSPVFYIDIPVIILKTMMEEPISLKEFMVGRYNYNPRIRRNMAEFIEAVKGEALLKQL